MLKEYVKHFANAYMIERYRVDVNGKETWTGATLFFLPEHPRYPQVSPRYRASVRPSWNKLLT